MSEAQDQQRKAARFQPGKSGNPGGRPKMAKIISDSLRMAAVQGAEQLRAGAVILVERAAKGDLDAWEYLRDTLEGKPTQAITNADDAPFEIAVIRRVIVKPQ